MRIRTALPAVAVTLILMLSLSATGVRAQEGHEPEPVAALTAALSAACRANETQFSNYLTADNVVAFRGLPDAQRAALMKRFSLADEAGKPLISSDAQDHTVFRCAAPEGTAEFRFGDVRTRENLAFVPVSVINSQKVEFGLVRENGGWRLLSLGLVLLDIPELSKQWAEGDLAAREDAAIATLRDLGEAIQRYRRAYGKLPDSLAQLGPAPKNEISPELADLVDEHLAAGSEGGYRFRYHIISASQDETAFELVAIPEDYSKTGRRSFFLDSAANVHGADNHGGAATADDPLIPSSP
jgi:type II secretory pathway pseudopilin PulG